MRRRGPLGSPDGVATARERLRRSYFRSFLSLAIAFSTPPPLPVSESFDSFLALAALSPLLVDSVRYTMSDLPYAALALGSLVCLDGFAIRDDDAKASWRWLVLSTIGPRGPSSSPRT